MVAAGETQEHDFCLTWAEVVTLGGRFSHCSTDVRKLDVYLGITRWEADLREGQAWLVWEWEEMVSGVVIRKPVPSISSNMLIVDEDGWPLNAFRREAMLATVVFQLGWEDIVLTEVESHASTPWRNLGQRGR